MTESPGPSAPVAPHNNEFLDLVWWPAEGTPLEADWSRATLAVVGRVWRAEGASLYWRPGIEALRDDLADWLVTEAMEFRKAYRSDDVEQRGGDDELATWCRVLYRVLCMRARRHFTRVMRVGLSPEETRRLAYSTDSIDRPGGPWRARRRTRAAGRGPGRKSSWHVGPPGSIWRPALPVRPAGLAYPRTSSRRRGGGNGVGG